MKKRILIKMPKKNDFKWGLVRFKYEDNEQEYVCNVRDWKTFQIKEKMHFEYGVPEDLIDELYKAGYYEGTYDSIQDGSI